MCFYIKTIINRYNFIIEYYIFFKLKNFLRDNKYRNYFQNFSEIESFEYKYNRREVKKLVVSLNL